MEVGGQRHAPAALPPGKTRYPLNRRLGGPLGRSRRVRKISHPPPPAGVVSPHLPSLANRYSDWSIPAQKWKWQQQATNDIMRVRSD